MNNVDITADSIRMSLDTLKHRSGCLFLEVNAKLEGFSYPALKRKKDILVGNCGIPSQLTLILTAENYQLIISLFIPDHFLYEAIHSLLLLILLSAPRPLKQIRFIYHSL